MTAINLDPKTLRLDKGSHRCEDGYCLMEARAVLLGRPKSDSCPPGTSPLLHSFGISLNDAFGDDRRQDLKRFLPSDGVDPLDGTADDGQDEARSYLALDWLIRTYTPAFLDLRPELADVAAELRGLRRIVDLAAAQSAGPVVLSAREKSYAARDAAWDAARDAARAAARDAARDAASAALQPTVDQLQTSAIELYAAMINPAAVAA